MASRLCLTLRPRAHRLSSFSAERADSTHGIPIDACFGNAETISQKATMNLFRAIADWFYGLCVAPVSAQREAEETERLAKVRAEWMQSHPLSERK
jgi:hypothetical protein